MSVSVTANLTRYKNFINLICFVATIICSSNLFAYSDHNSNFAIKIYLQTQNVDVFQNGILLKTIPCSTGIKPGLTKPGKFAISFRKPKSTWIEKHDGTEEEISYYYITVFNDPNAFHSMIEGNHPLVDEGKKLFSERKPSSLGCIRLRKEDAKWIYNLPIGTPVEVID